MGKKIGSVIAVYLLITGIAGICFAAEKAAETGTWDPIDEMVTLQRKIDNIFKESFARAMRDEKVSFDVAMTVKETKSAYIISADLPGMNKEDIDVELKDGVLSISGERKSEMTSENEKVIQEEQSFGTFFDSLTLPDDAKTTDINAEYKNGVLTISVPRSGMSKKSGTAGAKIPVK